MQNTNIITEIKCKICGSQTSLLEDSQMKVTYSVCDNCGFIYKNQEYHPSKEIEHKEYNYHNNTFECLGYVKMFEDFIRDYIDPLNISGKVLEFGSGPGPVLKELLRRKGHEIYDYDPFFNPNEDYLNKKYDLITSTEVAEHFVNPLKEFKHLNTLLNDSGYLVIMTSFNKLNNEEFLKWGYRRELTHVSFYREKTLGYLATEIGLELVKTNSKNVAIFKKNNSKVI